MERNPRSVAAAASTAAAFALVLSGCATKPRPPVQPELFTFSGIEKIQGELDKAEQQVEANERKLATYHESRCRNLHREKKFKEFPGIPIELLTNGCSFHDLVGKPEKPLPGANMENDEIRAQSAARE